MRGLPARLSALGLLAASAAFSAPVEQEPPLVRLLGISDWRVGDPYPGPQAELFADVPWKPFERLELRLHAALAWPAVPVRLQPADAAVDALVRWTPAGWATEDAAWVQVSPLGAPQLELGFDPLLRMGARVPGQTFPVAVAAGLERQGWSGWIAAKSVALEDLVSGSSERFQSFFVNGAAAIGGSWSVAVAGAYLTAAVLPVDPRFPVPLRPTSGLGGAARVIWRSEGAIGAPLDLERVRRAPWGDEAIFASAPPRPASGMEVVVEGLLGQQWQRATVLPFQLVPRRLAGGRASVRWAVEGARYQLGGTWRSPSLLVADQYGTPAFTAFSPDDVRYDDVWVDGSADVAWPEASLVMGACFRVRRPGGVNAFPGTRVLDPEVTLPAASPDVEWRASLNGTWTPVRHAAAFLQMGVEYDPNRVTGGVVPELAPSYGFRVEMVVQLAL